MIDFTNCEINKYKYCGGKNMSDFCNKIKTICCKYKKVAMFIDMDGTIVEYIIHPFGSITTKSKGLFINGKPIKIVINELEEISKIENLDLYILSMARSNIIVEEKKEWLKNNASFINEKNYIILNREAKDYGDDNRNIIKSEKILEKLNNGYDYAIFLDDDHKVIHKAQELLKDKCKVFHISSALI